MTPMPPACAMAMASRASVTVSIAEETIGRLRRMARVRREPISTALGMTVEWPGRSSTSSNARPCGNAEFSSVAMGSRPRGVRESRTPDAPPHGAAA